MMGLWMQHLQRFGIRKNSTIYDLAGGLGGLRLGTPMAATAIACSTHNIARGVGLSDKQQQIGRYGPGVLFAVGRMVIRMANHQTKWALLINRGGDVPV
jgi:hypothetical protein